MKYTKKNIVLDLDNTLLYAMLLEKYEKIKHEKNDKIKKFKTVPLYDDNKTKKSGYMVFLRPNLNKFLNFLFKNFNVGVWSSGNKSYVDFIVKNIILKGNEKRKNKRILEFVLSSGDCDKSEKNYGKHKIKDLRYIWEIKKKKGFDLTNTFIIDDLEQVQEIQPKNTFRIKSFNFGNKESDNDKHLEIMKDKLTYKLLE
jgi:hypothetical protein